MTSRSLSGARKKAAKCTFHDFLVLSSWKRPVLSLRSVEMYADLLFDEVGMRLADVMIWPRKTSSGSLAWA